MADTNTTAPAAPPARTLTPYESVKAHLQSEAVKAEFRMALPPQMPIDRFIRVAITAVNQNEDLLRSDRQSLYRSLMRCAQDGLLPDGQEAAIVPFGNQAQYMPMVKGILKKVRNSGELAQLTAQVVYKADKFRYWVDDDGEHLVHEPELLSGVDRGEIVGAYALAKTKDDAIYVEVMSKEEVEKVRAVSRAKNATPWTQWWDQMAKKTAIRRLSKRLPMSTDLDDLIRRDDEMYDVDGKGEEKSNKTQSGTPGRLSKLLEAEGRDVTTGSEDTAPAVDPEEDAKIRARQEELNKQKEQLKKDAQSPSPEEQEQIRKKEEFDSYSMVCAKCPPLTYGTNDAEAMKAHMAEKHANGNGGAKAKKDGGDLFGQKK